MKIKAKFLGYVAGIMTGAIIVIFSLQFVRAWVEPSAGAPNANIGAPITTGGATQNKAGQLNVTGGGAYGSGGLGFGFHTLNSNSNGWLYLGDQWNNVYGGRGLASESLWASGTSYASIFTDANDGNYYVNPNGTSRMDYGVFNNLYSYGWIQAAWYPDANDNNYYVDPNGTTSLANVYVNDVYLRNAGRWASQSTGDNLGNHSATAALNMNWNPINSVGNITSTSFTDANNGGYYVDPNNTSRLNYGVYDNLYSYGWMQSPIYYDANNTGFYLDPNGTSRLNSLTLRDQSTGANIKPIGLGSTDFPASATCLASGWPYPVTLPPTDFQIKNGKMQLHYFLPGVCWFDMWWDGSSFSACEYTCGPA